MCIAIPGKVTSLLDEYTAIVDFGGVERQIKLDLLGDCDDALLGQYVLVHVGYAISLLSEEEGKETLELLGELVAGE
ncbi:MAG: hydrogenase expression/formation protein HypC [Methanolobus sp.]|jgi:hydrogenase expression/formation protein HypC|uniref:Hydrogenase maturation factor n=1 Tax=Methanolobus tindarius DSM 2278 TaxID=1090322 RepID=W9E1L0_METTI|nr:MULTISPECIES: HypC/HybG/HupF family hydrogenase formation chaperone [Methanolobus]ETA69496.1 hydrogenase maturation factor [Methanolobus tindarius DSM 2278]MDI3486865.1 hydrogenase expression/formation protein HypC [Methanolobus sp.]MDK2830620.1 hydrogenase expression/formation protein HypC [Methanolobus sp.]MDK2940401.1 hydrogenase expression/formation protein HypC [Methanolobus sp.]